MGRQLENLHRRIKRNTTMKPRFHYICICLLAVLLLPSCNGCKKQTTPSTEVNTDKKAEESSAIEIDETIFDDNWNKINDKNVLSKQAYDELKLGTLSFIGSYGDLQYEIGNTLIDQDNKKLLTVKCVASGEISEYLLGYINNNITDSLLIAYEDNVEYFSKTFSVIKHNQITTTTINWDYAGMEEIADTIISKYIITPELTFEEIIEE